jgi:SOS response regulatory protein OraA/RecX
LSIQQLRSRLRARGCDAADVDTTIARLSANGTIDDGRVAQTLARHHAEVRHRGRARVTRELEAVGIDRETARGAVHAAFGDLDEAALLDRAIAKRLRGRIHDLAQFRRLYAYLLRQGFSSASALRALKARGAEVDDE